MYTPGRAEDIPSNDAIDDQFRRTIADRKRTDLELTALRQKLQDREESLVRLRDETNQRMSDTPLQSAAFIRPTSDADTALLRQVPELRAEVETERARRRELEATVVAEKKRIEQQMEEYHVSIGRRLMDTERERDRLSALLIQREQEVLVKDAELRSSYKENATVRDNLERVAKELVERNKRHDEVAARKFQSFEEEIKRGKGDQMKLVHETKELRDLLSRARNECTVLATQCDTAQCVNHDVTTDLQSAQGKANSLAKDLHEAQGLLHQQEALVMALREENDGLMNRIERLESAIQGRGHEELAEAERYSALRLQYASLEDEVGHVKQRGSELVLHVSSAVGLVYDEVRKVLDEVDNSRESFTQLVRNPNDDAEMSRRHEEDLAPEPMDPEELALEYLARCSDTLVVVWEEVHGLKLDTRHEILRREEYSRQVDVLREAYEADHAHIAELNGRIQSLTSSLNIADREKVSMSETMKESERWMDEAVRCTEEQKHRNEQLMVEKERVQNEIHFTVKQMDALRLACHEREGEIVALKTQTDKLSRDNWELQRTRGSVDDDAGKLRESVATMRNEMETTSRSLKRALADAIESQERCAKHDTEVRFARQQLEDIKEAKSGRENEIAHLTRDNRKLKDELVLAQRAVQEKSHAAQSTPTPDAALKDILKEKERQLDVLRRQRDDADGKCMKATEENNRLQARMQRDAAQYTPAKAMAATSMRAVTSAERVRELESRVTALLSSREIDAWRFK